MLLINLVIYFIVSYTIFISIHQMLLINREIIKNNKNLEEISIHQMLLINM